MQLIAGELGWSVSACALLVIDDQQGSGLTCATDTRPSMVMQRVGDASVHPKPCGDRISSEEARTCGGAGTSCRRGALPGCSQVVGEAIGMPLFTLALLLAVQG